ncbi:MAG TPA: hypothetical protein VFA32_08035 [Dehalococcoidia bacterium]|nr:hypothetical protein [Dehalococcoidia bacterium]
MKFNRPAVKLSATAHVLAWGAFLFLAFWPYSYQGTEAAPVGPDGSGGEVVHVSASLIEANGWGALIPLLVPVALTALGLAVVWTWDGQKARNQLLVWVLAAMLVVFCGLAMFSLGIFYLPAALALLASAIVISLKRGPTARQSPSA